VSAVASGVSADLITYVGPPGPTGNVWADPDNWDPDLRYPGRDDIARHNYAVEDSRGWILMNAPGGASNPHPVEYFEAIGDWDPEEPGALIMEGYCNYYMQDVCNGTSTRSLDCAEGAGSSVLNGYQIYIGPADAFVAGHPFAGQIPNADARADNFSWILRGDRTSPAWAASPAGFGPGLWNIDNGYVYAGIEMSGEIEDFTPIGDGIIDSNVQNTGAGNSEWFIRVSVLHAKRAEDLDNWRVEPAEFVGPGKGRSKPRQMNPYARRTVDLDRLT
jgi:hypothetical protein